MHWILMEQTKFIYDFIGRYFIEWLSQLDFTKTDKKLELDTSALYITFNYTNTLEQIYNINPKNIYHIHGSLNLVENMLDWVIPGFKTIEDAEVVEQPQVDEINNDTVRKQIQFGSTSNDAQKIKLELQNRFNHDEFFSISIEPAIEHIIGFCDAASKNLEKNY
jgi:Bacteriophage abortive infection AbiH